MGEKTWTWKDWMLLGLSIAGIGLGAYGVYQWHRTGLMIGQGVKKVGELTTVDVSQSIVNEAVQKAANRETERAVTQLVNRTVQNLNDEVSRRVQTAVSENYGTLARSVKAEIAKKAAEIDMDVLRSEATTQAKELIAQRFEGKLDSLLADYNKNLENVGKIYQSIANQMSADKAKAGVTLNVG